MARIETLKLDHKTMPAMDLRKPDRRTSYVATGETYELSMSGYGFEISRPLTADDLIAIRDWCDTALALEGIQMAAE